MTINYLSVKLCLEVYTMLGLTSPTFPYRSGAYFSDLRARAIDLAIVYSQATLTRVCECVRSYILEPIQGVVCGIVQEASNHIKSVVPAAVALVTDSQRAQKVTSSALIAHGMGTSLLDLASYTHQLVKGSAKVFSSDTLRVLSNNAYSLLLTYALFQVPQDKYYVDMNSDERFYFEATIFHSYGVALFLACSALRNFAQANIFKDTPGPRDWVKTGQAISKAVISALIFKGTNKHLLQNYSRPTPPKLEGRGSLEDVMKYLPGKDPEQVKKFLTLSAFSCSLSLKSDSLKLKQCHQINLKALDAFMTHSPDLVARIFLMAQQPSYRGQTDQRFTDIGAFLSRGNGLPLYFRKDPTDLSAFERILDRGSLELVTRAFECYSTNTLAQFPEGLSPHQLDTSRCYQLSEIQFIAQRHLLPHLSSGKSDTPAVYIEATTDWNGALAAAFEDQSGKILGEYHNPVIRYIRDHQNIFFAQVSSPLELCRALHNAKLTFTAKPVHILMGAHASASGLSLHDGVTKPGIPQRIHLNSILPKACLSRNVAEDATWVMWSCSAGAPNQDNGNIAQRISYQLPEGATVIAAENELSVDDILYRLDSSSGKIDFHFFDRHSRYLNITTAKYRAGKMIDAAREKATEDWHAYGEAWDDL